MEEKDIIQIEDWVEIIKESKTQGLLGKQFRVVFTSPAEIRVRANGKDVPFNYDEVRKLSFKEKWGFEKLPTLYHGTDLRFAFLPEEARNTYTQNCHSILEGLRDLYWSYIMDGVEGKELLSKNLHNQYPELSANINEALANISMMGWSEDFQYGDFYLTSRRHEACMYAHKAYAGGELGFNTYYLARGLQLAGVVDLFDKVEFRDFFKVMTIFVEGEHKPAIFRFDNLSPLYLRTEQNEGIYGYIRDGRFQVFSFRYLNTIQLDIRQAEILDKDLKKCIEEY